MSKDPEELKKGNTDPENNSETDSVTDEKLEEVTGGTTYSGKVPYSR